MTVPAQQNRLNARISELGGIEPAVGSRFNPLDDASIAEIEAIAEGRLPNLYREYLAKYGAAIFSNPIFYRPVTPFPRTYSSTNRGIVGTMLGRLSADFPRARKVSVVHLLQLLEDELPPGLVPIADNGARDLICVRVAGEPSGEILLWNHDSTDAPYLVNRSFECWLDSLALE